LGDFLFENHFVFLILVIRFITKEQSSFEDGF